MLSSPINSFAYYATNGNAPSNTPGTNVAGNGTTINTKGIWYNVLSALTADVYWVGIAVNKLVNSGLFTHCMLDIGVDSAGGSSYTAVVSNIICSDASQPAQAGGGLVFYFPIYIKAGSTVAIRAQTSITTASCNVVIEAFGRPSHPHLVPAGMFSETIGLGTAPNATPFTPGNSGANGSWASLGTTTKNLWWMQLCVQCTNTTITAMTYNFDLAYGDATNKIMLIEDMRVTTTTGESIGHYCNIGGTARGACQVPAGSTLYVRGRCSGTAVTGWQAAAVGVG